MKKPLVWKWFSFGFDAKKPASWRQRAVNLAEWEAWDQEQRRKLGWRAGLAFWSKTNVPGSRILLSRHWPHRLCWSWSIWVGRYRKGFDGPRRLTFAYHRGYRWLTISLCGPYLRLTWQDSDYMVGLRHNGPQILWEHHLRNAEPAGAA